MTEQQTALRGREAQQLLDSEVFKDAMAQLKGAVIDQWKACPVRDKEGQLLLLQLVKVTEKFESLLVGIVETGKFAQHKIDLDAMRDESAMQRMSRKAFRK